MKAVSIHNYGNPDVLSYDELPRPQLNHDDVLIRVHAASVNPVDIAVRQGYMAEWISPSFPLILGCDVSGVIEAVGPDVTSFKVDDEVYARSDLSRDGSYAEYIAIPASSVVHKPRTLDHIHAAAVPHVSLTAWQVLFGAANLSAGQTVLIHGAAGGVGHVAVQLAKWRGARVIGTASSNHLDFLRRLGVDEVVDYSSTRFEDVAKDVDVVFDTIGGETQERSWVTLKPGGILVSIVQPPPDDKAQAYGVRSSMVGAYPDTEILVEVAKMIDAGQIKPFVSRILPLSEARQAHEIIAEGHTSGKIVLQVL